MNRTRRSGEVASALIEIIQSILIHRRLESAIRSMLLACCSFVLAYVISIPAFGTNLIGDLSPESTYDLYAKALINYDQMSAEALRDHLAISEWNYDDWKEGRDKAEWTFRKSLLDISIEFLDPALDELSEAVAKSYVAAQKRVECHAVSGTKSPEGMAIVGYACRLIDRSAIKLAIKQAFPQGKIDDSKDARRWLQIVKAELDSLKPTRSVSGTVQLKPGASGGWHVSRWDDITDVLHR